MAEPVGLTKLAGLTGLCSSIELGQPGWPIITDQAYPDSAGPYDGSIWLAYHWPGLSGLCRSKGMGLPGRPAPATDQAYLDSAGQ